MLSLIRFSNASKFSVLMKIVSTSHSFVTGLKLLNTKSHPSPSQPPEWQKIGEELETKIKEASRLEHNTKKSRSKLRYLMYAGILFGVFSAMSEIADRLRISKLKEFVETLNDPIHEMVKNEMLANPTIVNLLGSPINLNHNGSLVYVIPASADQLQKRLDSLTSCSGKEKDDDGVEEYEGNKLDLYKSDVVYNVSGVKNSGNLSALLIIDEATKETRLEGLVLRLNMNDNVTKVFYNINNGKLLHQPVGKKKK